MLRAETELDDDVTRPESTVSRRVWKVRLEPGGAEARAASDSLATEEPLEIRLGARARGTEPRVAPVSLSVTMRTPGHDFELAAGFLFAEGIVGGRDEIERIEYCLELRAEQRYNTVTVWLRAGPLPDIESHLRHFGTTSSCGVCGKASLDVLRPRVPWPKTEPTTGPRVAPATIAALPERLRQAQRLFARTGGLHASGLFDASGELISLREDVGRHNALDKLIGEQLLAGRLPLADRVLVLSGRISFELVQKAAMAGLPMLVAVGAPSSLAAETAAELGITLVGFVRDAAFNIYTHRERILEP